MNPDVMDYQMDVDDHTIAPPQTMSQPRCPYRTPDAPNGSAFQSNWSHNPHLDPTIPPFNPIPTSNRMYWGTPQQNSQRHEAMTNRRHLPAQQTSSMNAAGFNTYNFGDSQSQTQNQVQFLNSQRFLQPDDSSRPAMPQMAPNPERFQGHEVRLENPTTPPDQIIPPNSSASDDAMQRRNEYLQAHIGRSQQEPQSNRNPLPPPTLSVQSTFFPTHLPQPNFTGNTNVSFFHTGPQTPQHHSSRGVPIPQISEARQGHQFEQAQRRVYAREAYNALAYAEYSDDDEPTEGIMPDDFLRYHRITGTEHPLLGLRHSSLTDGHSHRRSAMTAFDTEEREMARERARAARRAQAASVKLVASAAALAALQKVDLSSLIGDDRNCIICYNEFGIMNPDGNIECAVRLPKCKHVFGDHCLKQWLKDSDTCPYCRDKLPSEPKRSQADDTRRLYMLGRPHVESQRLLSMSNEERAAFFLSERQQMDSQMEASAARSAQVQAQIQALRAAQEQQMARYEEGMIDDAEARLRYAIQRQEEFHNAHMHISQAYPARSVPDYDSRRRNRQRASSIRTSNQSNQNRSNPPVMRGVQHNSNQHSPGHSQRPSFEELSSTPSSVTPHPAALGPVSSLSFSTPVRPSSLPSESSPLREMTTAEQAQGPTRNPPGAEAAFNRVTNATGESQSSQGQLDHVMWNGHPRPASESFLSMGMGMVQGSQAQVQNQGISNPWIMPQTLWEGRQPQP